MSLRHICAAIPAALALLATSAAIAAEEQIYVSSREFDQLHRLFFPSSLVANAVTSAAINSNVPELARLDDIYSLYDQMFSVASRTPATVKLDRDVIMDSYYLASSHAMEPGDFFRDEAALRRANGLLDEMLCKQAFDGSVVEKSLAQRDIFQMIAIVRDIERRTPLPELALVADKLAVLWRQLALTEFELAELRQRIRPTPDSMLAEPTTVSLKLTDHYLPEPVYGRTEGWFELPFITRQSEHFANLRGRSFIKVYLRAPGLDISEIHDVWRSLYRAHGEDLFTALRGVPSIPPGTAVALIRTAGILLNDWTYADSGIVESVRVRVFRHAQRTVDSSTSDYLGTLFFNYGLSRRKLMREPQTLGLVRLDDGEPAFVGLFLQAPHPLTSSQLTNVRFNCIGCHSAAQYGWNSIFSLSRKPEERTGREQSLEADGLLVLGPDRFVLNTPDFTSALERGRLHITQCGGEGQIAP